MQTLEVHPARWPQALAEFSAVHEGWLISLDILDATLGAQPEVRDLPLVGVVAEPGTRGTTITISVARPETGQITHAIRSATRVWIERSDEGVDVAMQIESSEGATTILRLKTPVRPETVDGLLKA